MRQAVLDSGHVIPQYTYQSLVQTTFVLDKHFLIEGMSANVADLLGYRPEILFNIPFKDILSIQSTDLWSLTMNEAAAEIETHYGLRVRSRLRQLVNLIAFHNNTKDKR